jgi:hypothetical protein
LSLCVGMLSLERMERTLRSLCLRKLQVLWRHPCVCSCSGRRRRQGRPHPRLLSNVADLWHTAHLPCRIRHSNGITSRKLLHSGLLDLLLLLWQVGINIMP